MASIPQQTQDSHRHQANEGPSSNSQDNTPPSSTHRKSSMSQSFDSEDSQTVLLDPPSNTSGSPALVTKDLAPQLQPDNEPRRCWICFADETEDTPMTSRWRSPCPCALKAHEACLLDWIADLENPRHQPKLIKCPQCKSLIRIRRPLSLVSPLVLAAQAAALKLTVPAMVASVAGTVVSGLWIHGFCTVFVVMGAQDGNRLLGLDLPMSRLDSTWSLSMPLIPLGLIAARTNGPNVEHVLAILPATYFYVCRDVFWTWPPSPATTLAALGWAQLAYKHVYRRFLTPIEQKWMKELQPRAAETQAQENQNAEVEGQAEAHGLQLGFEVQIEVDQDVQENEFPEHQHGQDNPEHPADNEAQEGGEGQPPPPEAAAPAPVQDRWEHMLDINIVSVIQKGMGALLFPTIAAAMGQGLKLALPRQWTTPPIRGLDRYNAGFFQSRFGRTIVGGCLFVVLKDALQFYTAYQLAASQKHRKVLNYEEIPKFMRKRVTDSTPVN